VDRLQKTVVDILIQIQHAARFEILTDFGQTVEDNNGYSDTQPTDGTVSGNDRY
jgi:hypothetical protein